MMNEDMAESGLLITAIISILNNKLRKENKRLCAENLHSEQKPLHGGDMFLKLAFLPIDELRKIAIACGL